MFAKDWCRSAAENEPPKDPKSVHASKAGELGVDGVKKLLRQIAPTPKTARSASSTSSFSQFLLGGDIRILLDGLVIGSTVQLFCVRRLKQVPFSSNVVAIFEQNPEDKNRSWPVCGHLRRRGPGPIQTAMGHAQFSAGTPLPAGGGNVDKI